MQAVFILESFVMHSPITAGTFRLSKTGILQTAVLIAFAIIVCRGPLLGDCFVVGVSFIAYMLSKNTLNLYLALPVAAGLSTHISSGLDTLGYIISAAVCGLVFAAAGRIKLKLWQRGVVAASVNTIAMSIYRLASGTVYMTSPEKMLAEGVIVFGLIYIFDIFFSIINKIRTKEEIKEEINSGRGYGQELYPAGFMLMVLMLLNGAGLAFLSWPTIVFVTLWSVSCLDTGRSLIIAVAGGIGAALMEESQWGIMVTIALGVLGSACLARYGVLVRTLTFAAVCWMAGYMESGVVLGMDRYCLLIPSILFLLMYWRFAPAMRRVISVFAGTREHYEETILDFAKTSLKERSSQIGDLSELYSTYLDSRAILSGQFDVTKQILDDIRREIAGRERKRSAKQAEEAGRFEVDIAISQCAAAGGINGDCCGWHDIGGGRIAMVISDGMGKGKKAAAESLMVTKTVISLLSSGVTTELTLKMINTIMLMKEDGDSYATLDMVIVDKRSGKARFYKIGAAPTLIRRKSNVEEVKLSAVPLGIVNGIKVRYMETSLKKGDWIIMMSDGISDGGARNAAEGGDFLRHIKEIAANVRSSDPRTMSDLIIDKAADSYIGRERDDLSVMVARIL